MFTGIVLATGRVASIAQKAGDLDLAIDAGALDLKRVAIGDSVSVSGVCLTATRIDGGVFHADVSRETLACTTGFAADGEQSKPATADTTTSLKRVRGVFFIELPFRSVHFVRSFRSEMFIACELQKSTESRGAPKFRKVFRLTAQLISIPGASEGIIHSSCCGRG